MASAEEALRKVREICLSLPDTREGDHFGEAAFYVKGRLFATCGEKHGVCEIIVGLEPAHAAALLKSDPRFRPYPRDKRAIVLDAAKVRSWSEVRALVVESYGLRKPRKARPRASGGGVSAMAGRKSKKPAKAAKKPSARRAAAKPVLLAGGKRSG